MSTVTLKSSRKEPINNLISSALEAEKREILAAINKTTLRLKAFEDKFHIPTDKFITQHPAIPELEAIEWLGEAETLKHLQDKLTHLEEIQVCKL